MPTIHAIFLLTVRRIRLFFSLKPSPYQGEIIPQNLSSLGFAVSEELGNIQIDTQTDSLTGRRAFIENKLFQIKKGLSKKFFSPLTHLSSWNSKVLFILSSRMGKGMANMPMVMATKTKKWMKYMTSQGTSNHRVHPLQPTI